jgi:hypothetical protein
MIRGWFDVQGVWLTGSDDGVSLPEPWILVQGTAEGSALGSDFHDLAALREKECNAGS